MRTSLIEIVDIGFHHASEMRFAHEQEMIQALTAYTADEAFNNGVGTRSAEGRTQDLDARSRCNSIEESAILAVVVVFSNVNPPIIRQHRPYLDEPIWRYDELSIGLSGDDDPGLDEG